MKSFIIACVAALAIAVCGALVLNHFQKTAESAFSTVGARV
jgi:hypothetical protein